jgi:YVTN family beta-propeller protein
LAGFADAFAEARSVESDGRLSDRYPSMTSPLLRAARRLLPVLTGVLATAAQAGVVVVLNSGDATVSLLDQDKRIELRRFDVGKEPHHLMATPDGKTLIVANAAGNDLHFLDPATGEIRRRLRDIPDPYQIGFSPDRRWFVANALRLDRVDIYEASGDDLRPVRRVPLARTPSHMAFSSDSAFVFVTLQESDEIAAIRLADQSVQWKIKVGRQPAGIWMTPDEKHLLVGIMGEDYVEVIDWRQQKSVRRIVTGKGAHNFRPLGDGRHVFVGNRVAGTVSVVDQATLEKKADIAVPHGPDCMEVSADRRWLWITQRWGKSVAVVDIEARRIVHSIPVGRSPHGIFFANSAPWR